MTSYYPLVGLPHGITSSITYSAHTLNQKTDHRLTPTRHPVDLAIYGRRGNSDLWELRDRKELSSSGDIVATSSAYGLAPGELLVCVPVASASPSEALAELLPKPYSKKLDRSPVAERCSLGFDWRGILSSYQGEYPLRMAELERGTFVSFSPLVQSGPVVGTTLLCLVTLARRIDDTVHTLECFDPSSRTLLGSVPYRTNTCCVVEISAEAAQAHEHVFRSAGSVGIPIFITLSRDGLPPSMSVEHTHPPTELFWEDDRLRGSRTLKSSWLKASLS